jgi:hypothetical protein
VSKKYFFDAFCDENLCIITNNSIRIRRLLYCEKCRREAAGRKTHKPERYDTGLASKENGRMVFCTVDAHKYVNMIFARLTKRYNPSLDQESILWCLNEGV